MKSSTENMASEMKRWRQGLDAGDLSAVFLVHHCFKRIDQQEKHLNALSHWEPSATLKAAEAADRRLRAGERGPMLGMPFIMKDNFNWKGRPSGHGSRITDGYVSPYNATVIERLLQAGAVPLAKANMDEFAMGSSGEYCANGPARNPWNLSCSPGGSSSGSIVSVAAGYVPFSLGSDTGGSVRLPAAFCNLTALRPTYGVLSRYGVTAMASSLDQVGPVGRTAWDVAQGLSVMAGRDPLDSTSVDLPRQDALTTLEPANLKGLKIGIPEQYFGEGLEATVKARIQEALDDLHHAGCELVPLSLPHTQYALDTYYLLNTAEVSSNLARFDGVRYGTRHIGESLADMMGTTRVAGFGMEAKRRILLGAFCLSRGHVDAFYVRAQQVRTLVAQDFQHAFEKVDIIATPTSPCTAFGLGEKLTDPMAMVLADIYTVTTPLAALPTLVVPVGLANQMPVGMQLMGPALSDVRLLEAGAAFQAITAHHLRQP